MGKFFLLVTAIIISAWTAAKTQEISPLAEAFGVLPEIRNVKISPDGSKILMLKVINGETFIVTRSLQNKNSVPNAMPFNEGDIDWVIWASNHRILAQLSFEYKSSGGKRFGKRTRMIAMDWDGENPNRPTGKYSVLKNVIIDVLKDDPDHILMQNTFTERDNNLKRSDIYKVNINTAEQNRIMRGPGVIKRWYTDKDNKVRYGIGYIDGFYAMYDTALSYYRKTEDNDWIELYDVDQRYGHGYIIEDMEKIPFTFRSYSDNTNEIIVSALDERGMISLFKYNIISKKLTEKIVEHEKFNLESFVFDDDYNLEEYGYFDSYLRIKRVGDRGNRLDRIFNKNFPDSIVDIVSESRDKQKIIINVSSPVEPGTYYVFDLNNNQMEMIGYVYQKVDVDTLSNMQVISYKARDGLEIEGFLSLPKNGHNKNLPSIIFPHGQPFSRDSWGFNYLVQFFTSQGFAVLQMNHRGSSGYGEEFIEKGFYEIGRNIINDINDGAKWMIEKGYSNADKICAFGFNGLSGYAALQVASTEPELYKCVSAFAPATDLERHLSTFYESKTWEFDEKSPFYNTDKLNVPILLAHGDVDQSAHVDHSRVFSRRLKRNGGDIKYLEFENEDHLLNNQEYRIEFLKETEKFLAKHLKDE